MNNVSISGRLTSDVEVRKTQSGLSVAAFTVAVQKDKDHADFINCVAWRASADFLGQYTHKGDMVGVMGRLSTRDYERDGHKVYVTEVTADRVEILAKKAQNTQNEYSTVPQQNRSQMPQKQPSQLSTDNGFSSNFGIDINNEDLPF